ncbi:nuclear transport factor 2 family protein [Rhodococcus sp. P1Y]|uniref:nuclear transport factor 2 family protein n=1 Tax=Rhodococcus sp. P1Y TaxID=1302308 RepID=UPI000EAEDA82|nr:nuclear transport factor 2 family protein [Rhodococcus sp. P1Y]AYJ48274.1 nuclear transport factor 2 family protein [Rhodococcus sp. P1Y]
MTSIDNSGAPGTESSLHPELQILIDRRAIHDVVLRYCKAIDQVDADLVRSCYQDGALDYHLGFTGTVDEFIAWCWPALEQLNGTRHVLANHLSEVDGDVATAESYVLAYHWQEPFDDPARNYVGHGKYIDRFARGGDGVWRISERRVVADFITGISAITVPPVEDNG